MASTIGIQNSLIVRATITGDASGGDSYTMTRPGKLMDAWTICTASVGGNTVTVSKATDDITSAMACATLDAIGRTTAVDTTYYDFATGDTLVFTGSSANTRGVVSIVFCPPLANSTSV